ncbi:hypothetical protein ACFTAO_03910 [Paenibacillus rhizoplanae]
MSAQSASPAGEIRHWQMKWQEGPADGGLRAPVTEEQGWIDVEAKAEMPQKPPGVSSAWTKITLPSYHYVSPSVYIQTIYALHVKVYVEDRLVFLKGTEASLWITIPCLCLWISGIMARRSISGRRRSRTGSESKSR